VVAGHMIRFAHNVQTYTEGLDQAAFVARDTLNKNFPVILSAVEGSLPLCNQQVTERKILRLRSE